MRLSVCLVTTASCAKTAEPIKLPFVEWTRFGTRNDVLVGCWIPPVRGAFGGTGISQPFVKYKDYSGGLQRYSLDGSSDAAVRCQYCGSSLSSSSSSLSQSHALDARA